jgi:hypothetical protein
LVTLIGFVGLSAVCWVVLDDVLDVAQLEPVRAALGGIGWMLFAFGWGAVRKPSAVPERDPHVIAAEPLKPRDKVPAWNTVTFAMALALGLSAWMLAWRVAEGRRALLAHAVGLAAAVAMVAVGVRVSIGLGKAHTLPRPAARLNAASTPLVGLLVLGTLGLLLWAFSG